MCCIQTFCIFFIYSFVSAISERWNFLKLKNNTKNVFLAWRLKIAREKNRLIIKMYNFSLEIKYAISYIIH